MHSQVCLPVWVVKNPQITDLIREDFSRKGAKAQSAAAFQKDFLCAFAGEIFCVICGWGYLFAIA
jgi:hypothetical protein